MQKAHNYFIHIDKDRIIEYMIEYHTKRWADLWDQQARGKMPARERQRLASQALVHKEMKEFWECVTFEPLKGEPG